MRRLSYVQLDSISTVERSHRLVLASRASAYPAGTVSVLLRAGRIFEFWAHEACLLPIGDFPLFKRRMEHPRDRHWWGRRREDGRTERLVLEAIRERGALPSRAFEGRGRPGEMWSWKPAKRARAPLRGRRARRRRAARLPAALRPPRAGAPPRAPGGARAERGGVRARARAARRSGTGRADGVGDRRPLPPRRRRPPSSSPRRLARGRGARAAASRRRSSARSFGSPAPSVSSGSSSRSAALRGS